LIFLLLLPFFGLTQEYRFHLFTQIHEIIFHGNGGYDWNTIYHMPIWLRKFTFNKIKEYYDKQNKSTQDEDSWTNKSGAAAQHSSQNVKVPDFISKSPQTYQTKASRK
jgi:hypothetical protein